jgi:hypothetical protein
MTAQPVAFHGARPAPKVPNTVEGIRKALPAELRADFLADIAPAIDRSDMRAVDDAKGKWWAVATWHADPAIDEAFAALDASEFAVAADPFAAR